MARHDPLFPNAAIVARREYVERVHSKLYRLSTVILMVLAIGVAITPIMLRYLDRSSTDRIAVIADDDRLAAGTIATANGIMNIPPRGSIRTPGRRHSSSSARPTATPRCTTWPPAASTRSSTSHERRTASYW
jgi:hypothetical protein